MKNKTVKAIILAGGYSKRMELSVPKQLAKINGKPLLAYTLDAFERSKDIDSIVLVVNRKFVRQCENLVKKYRYKKIERLCPGGKRRQQSVFNALKKIKDCDYVLIHDGVRPLVSQDIISRTVKEAKKFGAVTCAVKATDTIVEAEGCYIGSFLFRDKIWHIQTPQAFKFDLIFDAHLRAHNKKNLNYTDDTQLVIKLGNKVKIVEGSYRNLKVTTPFDLNLAKFLL